jgi:ADP-ribose pyrophosphatase
MKNAVRLQSDGIDQANWIMRGKIKLIANPIAGRGAEGKIRRAQVYIERRGHTLDLSLTGARGEAMKAEGAAKEAGFDRIIAAGGDGTLNEVINGLVPSEAIIFRPGNFTLSLFFGFAIFEFMEQEKRQIFSGKVVSLAIEKHELPDGRRASFEIVRHPGGAAALPLLADGQVVLIRQLRPSVGGMILEIPAGKLDSGELPEACILRELQEEVGYRAQRLEKLGEMLTAVGFCDERIHLFLALDLMPVEQALEPDEYIEIVRLPLEKALDLVTSGSIPDGKTQLALLLYAQRAGIRC